MAIVNKTLNTEEYVGMVLRVRGTFRMDVSMDEVLIWDPIHKVAFVEYIMGDTWANVDASEEVKAEYYQSIVDRQNELDQLNNESLLKSIRVGAEIKVVRGRKVPKGLIGIVKLIHNGNFGESILLEDGTWVSSKNVQVNYKGQFVEPETYIERKFFFQAI